MISQGKCISYLVALLEACQATGDIKNCLSLCNEPDHIFKSSEPLCSVSRK